VVSRSDLVIPRIAGSIFVLSLLLLLTGRSYSSEKSWFLTIAAGTLIFLFNLHLFIGWELQSSHWHWFVTPLVVCMALALFFSQIGQLPPLRQWSSTLIRWSSISILIVSIIHSIALQWRSYRFFLPEAETDQSLAVVLRWLNQNTPPESVVLSDYETNDKIAAYAHNNVYLSHYGQFYFSKKGRIVHNFFLFLTLEYGEMGRDFILQHPDLVSPRLYGLYWRQRCGRYECIPDFLLKRIANDYHMWNTHSLEEHLFKYRVDYILLDTQNHPT
jgi:hypothetical protein